VDEQDGGCGWNLFCQVGSVFSDIAESVVTTVANAAATGSEFALVQLTEFWASNPTTNLAQDENVGWLQDVLASPLVLVAIIGVLMAAGQMVWTQKGQPLQDVLKSLLTLVIISGAGVTGVGLLTEAADEFSLWLMDSTDLTRFSETLRTFLATASITTGLVVILAGICVILGALVQVMLLLVRGVMIILLTGVLPLSAAATNTEWGKNWFQKTLSWLGAFLLFKPTAAIVMSLGLKMMGVSASVVTQEEAFLHYCPDLPRDGFIQWWSGIINCAQTDYEGRNLFAMVDEKVADSLNTSLTAFLGGLILLIMASLALPALMNFIMPSVASMSTGGLTGIVAGGAALGAVGAAKVASGAVRMGAGGAKLTARGGSAVKSAVQDHRAAKAAGAGAGGAAATGAALGGASGSGPGGSGPSAPGGGAPGSVAGGAASGGPGEGSSPSGAVASGQAGASGTPASSASSSRPDTSTPAPSGSVPPPAPAPHPAGAKTPPARSGSTAIIRAQQAATVAQGATQATEEQAGGGQ